MTTPTLYVTAIVLSTQGTLVSSFWNRFDIVEAWAVLAWEYGLYGLWDRIERMGFKPAVSLNNSTDLNENAAMIYEIHEGQAYETGQWDRHLAEV